MGIFTFKLHDRLIAGSVAHCCNPATTLRGFQCAEYCDGPIRTDPLFQDLQVVSDMVQNHIQITEINYDDSESEIDCTSPLTGTNLTYSIRTDVTYLTLF